MTFTRAEIEAAARRRDGQASPITEGWRDGVLTVFCEGTPTHYKGKGHRYTVSRHTKDWRERTATRLLVHATWTACGSGASGYEVTRRWPWRPDDPKRIEFTVYTSGRGFDGGDNLKLVCSPALDALGPARTYQRNGVEVRGHGVGLIDDDKNPAHVVTYLQVVKAKVPGIAVAVRLA